MKIEPSGVVFRGKCEIQSPKCVARDMGVITAVHESPVRRQIDVCRPCLQEMVSGGEWEISGAHIRTPLDVVVLNQKDRPVLVVEVKLVQRVSTNDVEWASRVRRNMIGHGLLSPWVDFLLVSVPGTAYFWSGGGGDVDRAPDKVLDVSETLRREFDATEATPTYRRAELAVFRWLSSNLDSKPIPEWLQEIGAAQWGPGLRVVEQYLSRAA